ncbi:MAG: sigma-54-dependent Fis family transcriptional regulator [Bacteriovoracaceae bacterium]|nr:sigma-54-dependent Fis family transcriptional regulator [Bacteriovoracaceae bacterium]
MEKVFERWVKSRAPILLEGPTGTGKSFWAKKAHHEFCPQLNFVTVHLASICDAILESELFGHKRGAFTGAVKDHVGYCEQAHDGILFLDEIGELKWESQQKLLYLLEEGKYVPVGSGHEQNFTGKIIAATNRDLRKLVEQGKFREDLYYRLRVLTINFAPLAQTPEKIIPLLNNFLSELKGSSRDLVPVLSEAAQEYLQQYAWPGNIREVKNCAQYLGLGHKDLIGPEDLPEWLRPARPNEAFSAAAAEEMAGAYAYQDAAIAQRWYPLDMALAVREKQCLAQALAVTQGEVGKAAQILAITPAALLAKIKKYGINVAQWRQAKNG